MAYVLLGDKEKLNNLADSFLKSSLISAALVAYEAAENEAMVSFIKQNFNESQYNDKIYI